MKRALRSRVLSVVLAAAVALTSFALPGAVKQGKAYSENDREHTTNSAIAAPQLSQTRTVKYGNNINAYQFKTSVDTPSTYTDGTGTTHRGSVTTYYEYSNNAEFKSDAGNGQWVVQNDDVEVDGLIDISLSDSRLIGEAPGKTIYVRTFTVKDLYTNLPGRNSFGDGQTSIIDGIPRKTYNGDYYGNYYYNDPELPAYYDHYDYKKDSYYYYKTQYDSTNDIKTYYKRVYFDVDSGNATSNAYGYYYDGCWIKRKLQSPTSNVLQFTIPVENAVITDTNITSKAVTLKFSANTNANGFKIYRKSGKGKYKLIAKTNKFSYKDKGLTKGKKYTYRVKAYYYAGGKTVDSSSYTYTDAITAGSSLDLRIGSTGKKSNKARLTWKKVKGVKKYVIYRSESYSDSNETGIEKKDYSVWTKVKTLKKKKKSWTDKKIVTGNNNSYLYEVRAYINSKDYVEDSVGIDFNFSSPDVETQEIGNNTVLAKWDKIPGATGYQVTRVDETYDQDAGSYHKAENVVSNLGKDKTSIKLTAVDRHSSTTYYIYAIKGGNVYSSGSTVYVQPYLNATSAKATPTDKGIQVSWDPVPGATYYTVDRYTSAVVGKYNKYTKSYYASGYYYNDEESSYPLYGTKDSNGGNDNGVVKRINSVQPLTDEIKKIRKKNGDDETITNHIVYEGRPTSYSNSDELTVVYDEVVPVGSGDTYDDGVYDANGVAHRWSGKEFVAKDKAGNYYLNVQPYYYDKDNVKHEVYHEYYSYRDRYYYNTVKYDGYGYQYTDKVYVDLSSPSVKDELGRSVDYCYYAYDGDYYNRKVLFTFDNTISSDDIYDDHYVYEYSNDGQHIIKVKVLNNYKSDPVISGQKDSVRPADEITGTSVLDQYVQYGTDSEEYVGPKPGITYYYVVTAHSDSNSYYYDSTPNDATDNIQYISSHSVKNIASASWGTASAAAKKTSLKKLKAKKDSVKIKIKKSKSAGAEYIIYRSTSKKKGSFQVAGYTNKTTYTDTGLAKGTKYYYKVATSVRNSAGQYITSSASKIKKVKTKGKKAKASSKKSKSKKSKAKKSGSKKSSKKKSGKKKK